MAAALRRRQRQVASSVRSLFQEIHNPQPQLQSETQITPTRSPLQWSGNEVSDEVEFEFRDAEASTGSDPDNDDNQLDIRDELRAWSLKHNVTLNATSDLLKLLRPKLPNTSLPSDARTLMKTPRSQNIVSLGGGKYCHLGLEKNVAKKVRAGLKGTHLPDLERFRNLPTGHVLTVTIGVDGLPVSDSSSAQFWPILGVVDQSLDDKPFVIG